MASPNYQPVGKNRFNELKELFTTLDKSLLVMNMRGLFDDPQGETFNLKKDDTLALADLLQAEGPDWSRANYVEMLESLKE